MSFHLLPELLAGGQLRAHEPGLLCAQKTGAGLPLHHPGPTVVGTVPGLGFLLTGAVDFAALHVALRERSATHGPRLAEGLQGLLHESRERLTGHAFILRLLHP
jgi:hypothetical protein